MLRREGERLASYLKLASRIDVVYLKVWLLLQKPKECRLSYQWKQRRLRLRSVLILECFS